MSRIVSKQTGFESDADQNNERDIHGRTRERHPSVPCPRAKQMAIDIDCASRQADATRHHKDYRHQKTVNGMRVAQWVHREIALFADRVIAAAISCPGVAEFMQANRENPEHR